MRLGRYELITLIGEGGMAEVHLAMQRGPAGFEKLVVVKLVHEHLASQKPFVDSLLDEGRLAGMIKHPNVVDIYDLGEADGRYFVAMEYLDGEPLLAILRAGAEGKRLDVLSTVRVIADTAEGLEAAHRLKTRDGKPLGLVHHDVSLGNIVVLYTGVVKLVDFGVAKARSRYKSGERRARSSAEGDAKVDDTHDCIQGKFSYMAPEKLTEGAEVDRRSDIWSLGVVAYEALTLTRLFKGDDDAQTIQQVLGEPIPPPSQVNPDVPEDVGAIVMKALERDPAKRYSTAKAFALDLEEVLRKRGYSGKNLRIVTYMETTFAKQIAARERLLLDLSAGKPTTELQETIAAFRESATQTITSTSEHPRARPSDLASGELPVVRRSDPSWSGSHKAQSIKGLQAWVEETRKPQHRPLASYATHAVVAAVVLVLIVGSVVHFSGGDRGDAVAAPATLAVEPPIPKTVAKPAPAPAPEPAPPTDDEPGEPALSFEPDEIEMDPMLAKHPVKRAPAAPTASAPALYSKGIDEFRRRDYRAALASLTESRRADPAYAPAWYGLGMVNESLGNKGAAKAAYQRYLVLVPTSANALELRDRIKRM
ncbi:MAG: protein kinase [Kofleriaceae bacterium]